MTQHTTASAYAIDATATRQHPAGLAVLGAGPLELTVARVDDLTPRIRRFELRSPRGIPLPPWTPGAHIAIPVLLASGEDTRCYSLHGDCDDRSVYEIAVLRHDDGRGGSRAIHQTYHAGTHIRCEPPSNYFELDASGAPQILIAGGIGITPLRSMATHLAKRGTAFSLHYAARSPLETAFLHDLEDRFGAHTRFWHSQKPHSHRIDVDIILSAAPSNARIYVCGPNSLVQAVIDAGERYGLPRENIRYELFSPAAADVKTHAFDVVLARSGRTCHVPENQSILDTVLKAGVAAKFGCRAGRCGACAVTVLAGEVDHRDKVLSDAQRKVERHACICVSRATGSLLVIDL